MAALRLLISTLIFAASTAHSVNKNSESISHTKSSYTAKKYRLPDNVVPIHYNIKLIPYVDEGTFEGESSVDIWISRPTQNISLHVLDLNINSSATVLATSDGYTYTPITSTYDKETEILVFKFHNDLSPAVYTLSMKFIGILNNNMLGFYRTYYITEESKEVIWLAATKFEPTWARRAFPCWDEPALKATFNISVKHLRNYTVLSNMPKREQTDDGNNDGMIWTHFEKTPIMSTYLVAIIVSDYGRSPTEDSTVNMWTTPSMAPYASLIKSVAMQSKRILTEYTKSTYKVPKMDHFPLPKFIVAAMENWGLITYREQNFFYNEEKDPLRRKRSVATTAAHELAHQWFGNLVGPLWWSDLWLNEGFATFFAEYILSKLFSEWRTSDYFVVTFLQQTLEDDIEEDMMPVTYDVNTPKEIGSLFDWSTYYKGATILWMLQHILTEDVFQNGIIEYIRFHQFGSVTADDLWCAMQNALDSSDIPHGDYNVKEAMDTWIKQRNYPVIHVTRNYDNGDIILTQEYFRSENNSAPLDDDKWWVPITFATQSNPDFSKTVPSHWLRPQDEYISIKGVDPNDWIIVNVQETGYYRVQYDYTNWWRLVNYLNSDNYTNIHVINRAQIIDDFAHLSTSPFEQKIFLELTKYLGKEDDDVVHVSAMKLLYKHKPFFNLPESKAVKSHVLKLLSTFVKKVGYEENPTDNDNKKITRASALELACTFGHTECRKMAASKLNKHLADPETHKVSPNLRDWLFCNGMIEANASTVHAFVDKYNNISNESFLGYLACSENPDILNNILNTYVSPNDSVTTISKYKRLFTNIVEKHADNDLVLDYLLANINKSISRGYTVEDIFTKIANNIYSIDRFEKILSFVKINFDNDIFEQTKTIIDKRKIKLSDLIAKYHLQDMTGKLQESM